MRGALLIRIRIRRGSYITLNALYPECPISVLYLPSTRPVCGPAHALILYSMDELIRPAHVIRRGSWITLAGSSPPTGPGAAGNKTTSRLI